MSSIQGDINEIKEINAEIQSLRRRLAALKQQKIKAEDRINSFLEEKQQPGVKYRGLAVTLEEKNKRLYKDKKSKEIDGIDILEKYGITSNSKQVLDELMEAMRGELTTTSVIKVKPLKKKI